MEENSGFSRSILALSKNIPKTVSIQFSFIKYASAKQMLKVIWIWRQGSKSYYKQNIWPNIEKYVGEEVEDFSIYVN